MSVRSGDHAVWPNIGVIFNNHPARAAQMGNDNRPDPDLNIIAYLDTFRVVILKVCPFTDLNVSANAHAPPAVQAGPEGSARKGTGQKMQRPVEAFS
jgi:hypothetical protein